MDKFNKIMATVKKLLMKEKMKLILNNQYKRVQILNSNNKLIVIVIKILKRPKKMTLFNQPAIIFHIKKNQNYNNTTKIIRV